jgi:protein-S-isoprenylcysteine O-methyltransferase Ste14
MIAFVVATAIFGAFATFVVKRADADLRQRGGLSAFTSVSVWLLYLFHADTVAAASFTDLARVPLPSAPLLISGLVLAATGWVIFLAATVALVRHGAFERLETTRLVTSGPFSLSRHPQNAGWALLLLGIAIASRSLIALALVAAFAIFAARFARVEERDLLRRFGTVYASYGDRTPVLPLWRTARRRPRRAQPARPEA